MQNIIKTHGGFLACGCIVKSLCLWTPSASGNILSGEKKSSVAKVLLTPKEPYPALAWDAAFKLQEPHIRGPSIT